MDMNIRLIALFSLILRAWRRSSNYQFVSSSVLKANMLPITTPMGFHD